MLRLLSRNVEATRLSHARNKIPLVVDQSGPAATFNFSIHELTGGRICQDGSIIAQLGNLEHEIKHVDNAEINVQKTEDSAAFVDAGTSGTQNTGGGEGHTLAIAAVGAYGLRTELSERERPQQHVIAGFFKELYDAEYGRKDADGTRFSRTYNRSGKTNFQSHR